MNERNRILFTGRRTYRGRMLLVFFLLLIVCAYACAAPQSEASPFSDHLKNPPAFVPEFMAEKENSAALYSDEIYAIYATDKAEASKDKPAAVTASQIAPENWSLDLEARRSPVSEDHGNATRNDSLGGIIKGSLRF
jgi:hypothetical protein